MTDATGGFRLSEAFPQSSKPGVPTITDRDITATCPHCGVDRFMYDCDIEFKSDRTTYRCPDDGAVFGHVKAPRDPAEKLPLEAFVEFRIHVRGPNHPGPRWNPGGPPSSGGDDLD